MQRRTLAAGFVLLPATLLAGQAQGQQGGAQQAGGSAEQRAVLRFYADLGQAMFEDALTAARALQAAIGHFLATPSEQGLAAARRAWVAARAPYAPTEALRFGNPEMDEREGNVNAWPLDEGLIDKVDPRYGTESDENPLYTANIIASRSLAFAGETHDLSTLTPRLLRDLHQAAGVEANVTLGYHAIEFLLWGQDLHGTGPGAGERPFTDYTTADHAGRRGQYLRIAASLLVEDLEDMLAQWQPGGAIRRRLAASPAPQGIAGMVTGIGSLAYGELAGERMKLGLLLHDPEEEQDCFSDNTHNSHRGNVLGMAAIWRGEWTRLDGTTLRGPSLRNLVDRANRRLREEVDARFATTLAAFDALRQRAETTEAYDQMLAEGNTAGNATIQAGIDALLALTRSIERVAAALKLPAIRFEGSDSLDDPAKVFK
ncbi:peptidase [Roseomonas sp. GC11]|uniref:imelysin family protein n=1 Tax=Roseomonas sp. GC11 TaxID=2950546 RepID=UPI002108E4F6|nr:imelysin family protein [Roseomonas sp. GC11]MCQ4158349.1 peptidase [Roseomonas sp. GC11]